MRIFDVVEVLVTHLLYTGRVLCRMLKGLKRLFKARKGNFTDSFGPSFFCVIFLCLMFTFKSTGFSFLDFIFTNFM